MPSTTTNNTQTTTTLSLRTTVLLTLGLLIAFFPSLFHHLWHLPLSLLPSFILSTTNNPPNTAPATNCPPCAPPQTSPTMSWHQQTLTLPSRSRGCYLITSEITSALPSISTYKVGLLNLFIQHTSCALSLNENYDEDVRADMGDALDRIVPEDKKGRGGKGLYRHDAEGSDDMPAHVKSALIGASVTIPIKDGKLATGTWQGIWLLEFRDSKNSRRVVATIQGEKKA